MTLSCNCDMPVEVYADWCQDHGWDTDELRELEPIWAQAWNDTGDGDGYGDDHGDGYWYAYDQGSGSHLHLGVWRASYGCGAQWGCYG